MAFEKEVERSAFSTNQKDSVDSDIQEFWPKPSMMWLCYPAIVLAMTMMFSLGVCLGKLWDLFPEKGQRQKMLIRTGIQHYDEEGCGARRVDDEGEEDIDVYFTKTGTKVHLFRCPTLKSTDFEKMKKTTICKHCMKNRRLSLLKSD